MNDQEATSTVPVNENERAFFGADWWWEYIAECVESGVGASLMPEQTKALYEFYLLAKAQKVDAKKEAK